MEPFDPFVPGVSRLDWIGKYSVKQSKVFVSYTSNYNLIRQILSDA